MRPILALPALLLSCVASRSAAAELLVAMNGSGRVERYDLDGRHLGTFISGLPNPNGLAYGPDGNLYLSTGRLQGPGTVRRYDGRTGRHLGDVVPARAAGQPGALVRATGMAWHGGDLFVASCDDGRIQRFEGTTGAYKGEFARATPGNLTQLCVQDGKVYVADFAACGIRRFDLASGTDEGFAVRHDGFSPWGVAFDGRGRLYWSGHPDIIRRLDASGDAVWAGPRADLQTVLRLEFGSDGLLYCVGYDASAVTVWSPDGQHVRTIGGSTMHHPIAIAFSREPLVDRQMVVLGGAREPGQPVVRLEADLDGGLISSLGWDTEGGERARLNILASAITLGARSGSGPVELPGQGSREGADGVVFRLAGPALEILWRLRATQGGLAMEFSGTGAGLARLQRLELVLPFAVTTAVTSVISSQWDADGRFRLPAILSAPDLGQMVARSPGAEAVPGRVEGSRSGKTLTVTLELPVPAPGQVTGLELSPVVLPLPPGYRDAERWAAARRGWFNFIQQSCGASGGGTAVHGVWANNALSDPVSSVLYMLGDATLLVPELAEGVSMAPILRHAVEYWLDAKTDADGLVTYTAAGSGEQNVMDSNPAVLIGAWAYVSATADLEWLRQRIGRFEFVSRYLEQRDVDGDGLVESKQSGNSGSRPPRDPDCAWDCYNSGHKNAYVNALIYRAWLGLADLERQLGRPAQEQHYRTLAARLQAPFLAAFYNPETGWLGFWRSRDGVLHDLYMDAPTSLAVGYGLVSPEKGREMLQRYWEALRQADFDRFDLGVPLNLRPVPREEMEHYTEFQQFLNGGCGVSNTSYLLDALYRVGMSQEADQVLDAMLRRQKEGVFANGGGFQNGFVDQMGRGAEVFDWKGNPAGYEGHLVYCWAFLHSMLRQEPALARRCLPPSE
jgi:sugar lactone lactonase YvrE